MMKSKDKLIGNMDLLSIYATFLQFWMTYVIFSQLFCSIYDGLLVIYLFLKKYFF